MDWILDTLAIKLKDDHNDLDDFDDDLDDDGDGGYVDDDCGDFCDIVKLRRERKVFCQLQSWVGQLKEKSNVNKLNIFIWQKGKTKPSVPQCQSLNPQCQKSFVCSGTTSKKMPLVHLEISEQTLTLLM